MSPPLDLTAFFRDQIMPSFLLDGSPFYWTISLIRFCVSIPRCHLED